MPCGYGYAVMAADGSTPIAAPPAGLAMWWTAARDGDTNAPVLGLVILATARLGGINLHGSLLPKYRGAAPVQQVGGGAADGACEACEEEGRALGGVTWEARERHSGSADHGSRSHLHPHRLPSDRLAPRSCGAYSGLRAGGVVI